MRKLKELYNTLSVPHHKKNCNLLIRFFVRFFLNHVLRGWNSIFCLFRINKAGTFLQREGNLGPKYQFTSQSLTIMTWTSNWSYNLSLKSLWSSHSFEIAKTNLKKEILTTIQGVKNTFFSFLIQCPSKWICPLFLGKKIRIKSRALSL